MILQYIFLFLGSFGHLVIGGRGNELYPQTPRSPNPQNPKVQNQQSPTPPNPSKPTNPKLQNPLKSSKGQNPNTQKPLFSFFWYMFLFFLFCFVKDTLNETEKNTFVNLVIKINIVLISNNLNIEAKKYRNQIPSCKFSYYHPKNNLIYISYPNMAVCFKRIQLLSIFIPFLQGTLNILITQFETPKNLKIKKILSTIILWPHSIKI